MKSLMWIFLLFTIGCGWNEFNNCDYYTYDGIWNICVVEEKGNSPGAQLTTSWIRQTDMIWKQYGLNFQPIPIQMFFINEEKVPKNVIWSKTDATVFGYTKAWNDRAQIWISLKGPKYLVFHEFSHVILKQSKIPDELHHDYMNKINKD